MSLGVNSAAKSGIRTLCDARGWTKQYEGSVKNIFGPVRLAAENFQASTKSDWTPAHTDARGVVFEYTDAYSVFDWGRMPDPLANKGRALATLAAYLFEQLERAEQWKAFSRSSEALELRKGNRFGNRFIELGEELQNRGLRTHYLGILRNNGSDVRLVGLEHGQGATVGAPDHFVCHQVSAVKPMAVQVMGKSLYDYSGTRTSSLPRLIPLEVVFRFGCPEGSSLFERLEENPNYLDTIGFSLAKGETLSRDSRFGFPILELFTKLESTDRVVNLAEALNISGINGDKLQDMLFRTAWTAGFLRWHCAQKGLELLDGKFEWAISDGGEVFLVDAIGPDELRLSKKGVSLSKEFLRAIYRKSPWYQKVVQAKAQSKMAGTPQWKKFVGEEPPHLDARTLKAASDLYPALTETLTGMKWFENTPPLDEVIRALQELGQ